MFSHIRFSIRRSLLIYPAALILLLVMMSISLTFFIRSTQAVVSAAALAQVCCGTWTQRSTTGPSARNQHAMAYDSARQRVVLFGGTDGTIKGDTWEWDGLNWTQVATTGPSARAAHAMAYDSVRQRVVLFGGYDSSFVGLGDTWEWNGTAWTQVATTGPSIRHAHAMAYDSANQKVVLFGGSGKSDTWEWNGTAWTQINIAGPGIRQEHAMAYDSVRQRIVLFGGSNNVTLVGDTWEYNGSAWTQVATTGPGARTRHALAYSSDCQRVFLFGGGGGATNDLWEWDGMAWMQTTTTAVKPSARHYHALVYDNARQRLVLFGGSTNNTLVNLGDTWEFLVSTAYTYSAGSVDNLDLPADPTSRSAALTALVPLATWKDFDVATINRWVGHTFTNLPANITRAELVIGMKPLSSGSDNDGLALGLNSNATFAYSSFISALPGAGGTWNSNQLTVFTLDLANLPGGGDILAKVAADRFLDVRVQDDTVVDYVRLRVWTCPPQPKFGGLPITLLGQAQLANDPNGSLLISNFGSSFNDGAAFAVGAALLSEGAGVSILPDDGLTIPNPGGELKLRLSGRFNGIDQTLGTVTFKKLPDYGIASTDFSPLGVSSYLVQVFSGNTLVSTFSGHSGQNIMYRSCTSLSAPTAKSIPGIDVSGKKSPGNKPEARFAFGGCFQFDFGAGHGVSQGDRLVLTSTTEVTYTQNCVLTEARLVGNNYGQFALGSMGVIALNQPFQTLGEAHLGAFGNAVTVANIRSSGQQGANIIIDEDGIKAFRSSFAPFNDSAIPVGAYLQVEARCCPSPQSLGRMRETRSVSGYSVTHDFGAITPATHSVTVYNNNAPVLVVDGFTGAVGASSSWKTYTNSKSNTSAPSSVNAAAGEPLGGQTSNTMSLAALYPANTVFRINGTDYVGDQLEFKAVGVAGTGIGDFSALTLMAADIPEFTILDVQSVPEDNAPTIAAVALARQAGSPVANSTIANVNDTEDAENSLTVKVNNAASATVNGVTVSGLSVNSAGVVTANVVAACGATSASFALTVTDSGGTPISASFDVTVTTVTLSQSSQSFAGAGGMGSFTVNSLCNWQAVNNAPSFITINTPAGGQGSGNQTLTYTVASNIGGSVRSGTISIAGQTFTVRQGIDFLDVPTSHPFYAFIGKLSAHGVTLGCGSGNYCPEAQVTREQMAAFIIRALGDFNPPTPASQRFADVPPSNIFYAFIEELAARQITLGCGSGNYCPASPVTREQMAAFIMRALGEFNPPTPATQRFADVPPSNPFYNFIDRMAVLGITLGCSSSPPLYCPTSPVTRAQLAAFLVRAFNL